MSLQNLIDTERELQQHILSYTRKIGSGRIEEANCKLVVIKKYCDDLDMDWEVVMNLKDGYLFKRHNTVTAVTTVTQPSQPLPLQTLQPSQNPSLSVTEPLQTLQCLNCNGSMESKKTAAKFCSAKCKTEYHRKNGTAH